MKTKNGVVHHTGVPQVILNVHIQQQRRNQQANAAALHAQLTAVQKITTADIIQRLRDRVAARSTQPPGFQGFPPVAGGAPCDSPSTGAREHAVRSLVTALLTNNIEQLHYWFNHTYVSGLTFPELLGAVVRGLRLRLSAQELT